MNRQRPGLAVAGWLVDNPGYQNKVMLYYAAGIVATLTIAGVWRKASYAANNARDDR